MSVWVCLLVVDGSTSNGLLDLFSGLSSFFQALAGIVVSLLIIALAALVAVLVWHVWQQGRAPKLVIDPFINGTGNADLDKLLPGLNQLLRETLVTMLNSIREHIYHESDQQTEREGNSDRSSLLPQTSKPFSNLLSHAIDRYPLPETISGAPLNDLLASLQAGRSGPLQVQIFRAAMGERGTRIITTLQSRVDAGDGRDASGPTGVVPGLSFEILALQGKRPAQLSTFWMSAATLSRPLTAIPSTTTTLSTSSAPATGSLSLEQPAKESASASSSRRKKTAEVTAVQPTAATNTVQEGQYLPLLQSAARWLAIELARAVLLADENRHWKIHPAFRGRFKQPVVPASQTDRARLANFSGYFHLSAALACSQFPAFYELAIHDFQQAIALDEEWYQPRENLADTYVMRALETIVLPGREERSISSERPGAKVYLYKAMACYDEALHLLDQQEHLQAPPTPAEQAGKEPWRTIERRIQLGKSIALLLLADEENVKRSMRGLKYLRSTQWNLEEERDSRLLYNFACWYALADLWQLDVPEMLALPDESAKQAAFRYLIYSIARDSKLWLNAPGDPCFSNLFPTNSASQHWDRLQLAAAQKDYEVRAASHGQRDLSTLKGKDFEEAALTIRQRVWGDEQM